MALYLLLERAAEGLERAVGQRGEAWPDAHLG